MLMKKVLRALMMIMILMLMAVSLTGGCVWVDGVATVSDDTLEAYQSYIVQANFFQPPLAVRLAGAVTPDRGFASSPMFTLRE